ncbi:hypothetical protein TUA1478L_33540 [Lactiplantibacillus plantarum]
MIEVAEQNKSEMVLPLTNIPRSMQLIKQALSLWDKRSVMATNATALTQSMDMSIWLVSQVYKYTEYE